MTEQRRPDPFAFLAALAFLAGFVGYLAVSVPVVAKVYDGGVEPARAQATGPVSAEWRHERRI